MDYDDEALLTPKEYDELAKAYEKQRMPDFFFVRLDTKKEEQALRDVFDCLGLLKSNLFALGGFLGTGALFNLTNKQIERLQELFNYKMNYVQHKFIADKTKCFLNMLSLENLLIDKLLELAMCSSFAEEIVKIIKERTMLSSSLYHVNGIISSFVR